MSALFVLNSMMQKIIAQKHVKRVHYINEMSAIFEPNSLNPKSKSMLKITLHKWHKCYICNKFFKPKILAWKHVKKVHYINGMSAIFVHNYLGSIALQENMSKQGTY